MRNSYLVCYDVADDGRLRQVFVDTTKGKAQHARVDARATALPGPREVEGGIGEFPVFVTR